MLSGRRKRDYEVEWLAAQATGEDAGDKLGKRGHSSTPAGPFRAARNGTIKPWGRGICGPPGPTIRMWARRIVKEAIAGSSSPPPDGSYPHL
jgi:hypothetical protein